MELIMKRIKPSLCTTEEQKKHKEKNLFRKDMIAQINFWKNLPVTMMQLCAEDKMLCSSF